MNEPRAIDMTCTDGMREPDAPLTVAALREIYEWTVSNSILNSADFLITNGVDEPLVWPTVRRRERERIRLAANFIRRDVERESLGGVLLRPEDLESAQHQVRSASIHHLFKPVRSREEINEHMASFRDLSCGRTPQGDVPSWEETRQWYLDNEEEIDRRYQEADHR